MSDLGFPCIGCGYLYDGVAPGSSIVDELSVKMLRTSDLLAEVTWGSDSTYTEAAIERADFAGMHVTSASEVVAFEGASLVDSEHLVARRLINHLAIVSSAL